MGHAFQAFSPPRDVPPVGFVMPFETSARGAPDYPSEAGGTSAASRRVSLSFQHPIPNKMTYSHISLLLAAAVVASAVGRTVVQLQSRATTCSPLVSAPEQVSFVYPPNSKVFSVIFS